MGFGDIFSFLKPKNKTSPVPNLDSKSSDIPMPGDPFSSQPFGQGVPGSKQGSNLNDLPDFPDFPEFGSAKHDMVFPPAAPGVEPPKPITSPSSSFNFDSLRSDKPFSPAPEKKEEPAAPKRSVKTVETRLNDFETYGNEKYIGVSPELDSEQNHFVNIHDYRQTIEFVDNLKDNIAAFENSAMQLHDLSNNSAVLEDNFRKTVEDIQRKLVFVDKTLFETHAR